MPDILADSEPYRQVFNRDHAGVGTRLKVTLFIKDLIIGQALLIVLRHDCPVVEHSCAIE